MPYKLVRADGTDKYYVMTTDTGRLHSKEPMTKMMAKRQMTALNLAHAREKGYDVPSPLKRKVSKQFSAPLVGFMGRLSNMAEEKQRMENRFV